MNTEIPSAAEVRASLAHFRHASLQRLAKLSGVPYTTLDKIRIGKTKNPGVETVRSFLPHVDAALEEPATQPGALS